MFEVREQIFECQPGGVLDTSKVTVTDLRIVEKTAERLGLNCKVKAANDGTVSLSDSSLRLSTEIEPQSGKPLTVAEALKSNPLQAGRKLRCQAPFRQSESFAAFLSVSNNGKPFVHDSGTGITHWLSDEEWREQKIANSAAVTPLFRASDYLAGRYLSKAPSPRRWLMQGVIPAGIVFALIAPGGTGKTMFALQMGASCATGQPFAGAWSVDEAGAALMLFGEDDDEELHRRLWNIAEQMALSQEAKQQIRENLYVRSLVGEETLLTTADSTNREVRQTSLVERVILTAKQIPNLKLIVIDPASRWRGGDENAAADATRFVQALERISQATGASVMVIHHTNKGAIGAADSSQSAARGSSALTDGIRLQINLAGVNDGINKRLKLHLPPEEWKRNLVVSITKTNYSAPHDDLLLRRGEGGYLSLTDGAATLKEPSRLDIEIMKKVRAAASQGKPHSRRSFCEEFGGLEGPFKRGEKALRAQLDTMIKAGHISLNDKNRLT